MILVIVYVGAVAVLFLFVVMMLDVDFAELKKGALQYLPFGALIGADPGGRAGDGGQRLGAEARAVDSALAHATPARHAPTPKRWGASSIPTMSITSRSRAWCCWSP